MNQKLECGCYICEICGEESVVAVADWFATSSERNACAFGGRDSGVSREHIVTAHEKWNRMHKHPLRIVALQWLSNTLRNLANKIAPFAR